MATLAVIDTFAVGTPPLQVRFRAARLQVAWNVLAENAGVPTALRKAWAVKIFTNYNADDYKEYLWCLSHSLIQAPGRPPPTPIW
jgi:hypothetical protein